MNRLSFSRTQILILLSVWLTFLLSFVMRLSWASVMPILNEALHFTAKMGSQHISAFYFGYALTVLPGGILADKIGYRRTILFSLIGMAAVTALMSTITDYNMAWGLRFLLGIMSGPVQASCLSAIRRSLRSEPTGCGRRYLHELYLLWYYYGKPLRTLCGYTLRLANCIPCYSHLAVGSTCIMLLYSA